MPSKLSRQGELLIDHRNSPGISPEWAAARGLPQDTPIVGGGKTYETGLLSCSHCGADVIMNPQRTRDREWCMGCDRYICDSCGYLKKLGKRCMTLQQKLEELFVDTQNIGSF